MLIQLLLVFCGAAIAGASVALAGADESPPYRMPAVYVSASRIAAASADEAVVVPGRNLLILDAAEIARRAPQTLADLLAGLPGVDARTRGPFDVQTDLEINGATFSQVLVLVDGMRVSDPQTGHHTLNLPLAPQDLERVEVVYGPGSSLHGPDAFGAVVNLVPRSDPAASVLLATRVGRSLDDSLGVAAVGSEASLRYGWGGEWGRLWVAAGKARSDGYRDDTDLDSDRILISAQLAAAGGQLHLLTGVADKEFGANDFYAPFPSKEWTQAQLYSARLQRLLGGHAFTGRVSYRRHRDRFILFVDNPDFYDNRHVNKTATAELHGEVASGSWGTVVVGGEFTREVIDSNNLGEHRQNRGALFGEYRGQRRGLGLSAGLRLDRHEGFGWEASPSLAGSLGPPQRRLFASVGRSYRAPSFTEFYYEDPNHNGNADLGAERAWSFESGFEVAPSPAVHVRAAAFARLEENLVDYIRPQDTPPWEARNLGEMRTSGVNLLAAGTWKTARVDVDYAWVDKEQTLDPGLESKYVFTHPRHQLGVRLHQQLTSSVAAAWHVTARERQRQKDYALIGVVVTRSVAYGEVRFHISNLTDERYEAVAGAPMPGRWLALEARLDL